MSERAPRQPHRLQGPRRLRRAAARDDHPRRMGLPHRRPPPAPARPGTPRPHRPSTPARPWPSASCAPTTAKNQRPQVKLQLISNGPGRPPPDPRLHGVASRHGSARPTQRGLPGRWRGRQSSHRVGLGPAARIDTTPSPSPRAPSRTDTDVSVGRSGHGVPPPTHNDACSQKRGPQRHTITAPLGPGPLASPRPPHDPRPLPRECRLKRELSPKRGRLEHVVPRVVGGNVTRNGRLRPPGRDR